MLGGSLSDCGSGVFDRLMTEQLPSSLSLPPGDCGVDHWNLSIFIDVDPGPKNE